MPAKKKEEKIAPTPLTVDTDSLRESPGEVALHLIEGQWYRAKNTPHSTAIEQHLLWKVVRIDKDTAGNPTQAWVQFYGESRPSAKDPHTMVCAYSA